MGEGSPPVPLTNWLLAPPGEPFSLYLRAYWPDAEIVDGRWTPPAIERCA